MYEIKPELKNKVDTRAEDLNLCKHCGNICPDNIGSFCCSGCEAVYSFINSCELSAFYQIKSGIKSPKAKQISENLYLDYDHRDLKEKYYKKLNQHYSLKIYVEGVHCTACLWILEKLPELCNELISAKLDMSKKTLTLLGTENLKLSEVLFLISKLGYHPHPLQKNDDFLELLSQERRKILSKLGVTAALTGNIMLMTTGVYGGAIGDFKFQFHWIAFFLSIGIVFYSATDFYKNSVRAIKQKGFSVDYSISVAILFGFIISTYNLLVDGPHIYFDSIASLCFLILASRYLLNYSKWQNQFDPESGHPLLPNLCLLKTADKSLKKILPENISADDILFVEHQQRVPCDGILLSKHANLDESILTGESESLDKHQNDLVYAGAKNLGPAFEYKSTANANESKIFKVLEEAEQISSKQYIETAQSFAKILSIVSHLAAILVLFYSGVYLGQWHEAFGTALAILIISCPCAFAIATPLSLQRANHFVKKLGVIPRNIEALEKLSQVKNIFFDKTGTLTENRFEVVNFWHNESFPKDFILNLSFALEKASSHPIAHCLRSYASKQSIIVPEFQSLKALEIPGVGVSGKWKNQFYQIKSIKEETSSKKVALYEADQLIAFWELNNQIKNVSYPLVSYLNTNYKNFILSGDNKTEVRRVAEALSIKNYFSEKSPREKAGIVSSHTKTLMVGDGVNDSLALKKADVGIATKGSIELAFRSSQFYIKKADLEVLPYLISLAKSLKFNIQTNYIFSLIFNFVGISLALTGYITPLSAAILMPASSLLLSIKSYLFVRQKNNFEGFLWKS